MKTLIIYHKNCFDGICAAWVAKRKFPDADILPMNYGDDITNIYQDCMENANINDNYIFVDFSLPRDILDLIANKAKSLLVIDHHKTAEVALKDASYAIFDMNESGASLAWKTFFPNEGMPLLVKYIKDRDLWLFKEYDSEAINSYIQSFPMTIENYDQLNWEFLNRDIEEIGELGNAINRYKQTMVEAMCKNSVIQSIGGYMVPVVNASILFSEVGNELCKTEFHSDNFDNMSARPLFAAYYFDRRKDGIRQWGLRSIGDFDVSEVAKKFGGGGHKNAAGFQEKL